MISEIESAGLRVPDLNKLLVAEFQQLDNLLSETVFAAYLLAHDDAQDEILAVINTAPNLANLSEGDKKKPKRQRALVRRVDTAGKAITYLPHGKDQTAAEIGNIGKDPLMALRFDVPPQEAIDYFKRKRVLPADQFYKLRGEAKAGAFAIGKVYQTDVTTAFHNELISALENGTPQREMIQKFKDILAGAGHAELGDAHLETVFRTATQMAYGVGRRAAQEDVADYLPIWEYSAVGDDRTRPSHMALDGLQYPANHPFWDKYYPPWDFRCRCSVIPIFDYRKGYDPNRPNDRTVVEFDKEGLPAGYNVDGTPGNIKTTNFVGVPRQANLEQVLTDGAARALDARKK